MTRARTCGRFGVLVALLAGLWMGPRGAAAQRGRVLPVDPRARAHFERGLMFYHESRYQEALEEFRRSYDLDPRPELLYSLGQAARGMGDCDKASEYFRAFLRTSPPTRQVEAARVQMARCERARLHEAERRAEEATPPSVAAEPAERPRRRLVYLTAGVLGDLVSQQVGGEMGGGCALGSHFEVGAIVVLGRNVGGRIVLGLHPRRGGPWAVKPALEVRAGLHAADGGVAGGGGLWLGGTVELGRGRLRPGVAVELYAAPAAYFSYAVLAGLGYALDL